MQSFVVFNLLSKLTCRINYGRYDDALRVLSHNLFIVQAAAHGEYDFAALDQDELTNTWLSIKAGSAMLHTALAGFSQRHASLVSHLSSPGLLGATYSADAHERARGTSLTGTGYVKDMPLITILSDRALVAPSDSVSMTPGRCSSPLIRNFIYTPSIETRGETPREDTRLFCNSRWRSVGFKALSISFAKVILASNVPVRY